jgi:hypothetical protein
VPTARSGHRELGGAALAAQVLDGTLKARGKIVVQVD